MKKYITLAVILFTASTAIAQFLESKKNLLTETGFFTTHYDQSEDKLYLEVDKLDTEFIFVHSLRTDLEVMI